MTTPLFPANNGFITMRQGRVGDCYLLTALDCIFNSGEEGHKLIKSLFTPVRGGVEVRLKCSDLSENLRPAMMRGKYRYFYDEARNEDVFFLSKERLDEIDCSQEGVITNSLGVKILERLSAYYYSYDWSRETPRFRHGLRRSMSLNAHNLEDAYDDSSTTFVSKFLGIDSHDCDNINKIIQLKTIFPDQPIYCGMDYGRNDAYGRKHNSHALRVDKITPDRHHPDHHDFVLVNPWNNTEIEVHSSRNIQHKDCHFSIYKTNPERYKFTRLLLRFPDLLKMTYHIKLLPSPFNLQDIECWAMLHHYRTDIAAIFGALSSAKKQALVSHISAAIREPGRKTNRELIQLFEDKLTEVQMTSRQRPTTEALAHITTHVQHLNALPILFTAAHTNQDVGAHCRHLIAELHNLTRSNHNLAIAENNLGFTAGHHHPLLVQAIADKTREIQAAAEQQRLTIENAHAVVSRCVHQINTFTVSFDTALSVESVMRQRSHSLTQLNAIVSNNPEIMASMSILGYRSEWSSDITQALDRQIHKIDNHTRKVRNNIASREHAAMFLEETHLSMYSSRINDKSNELRMMAETNNGYEYTAGLAEKLNTSLKTAKNDFIFSEESKTIRLNNFKSSCLVAIREAAPILESVPDWQNVLHDMAGILLVVSDTHSSHAPTARLGLFPTTRRLSERTQDEHHMVQAMRSWGS